MRIRTLALSAAALALAGLPSTAHADHTVTVSLAISAGRYAPTGAACEVVVDAGADGIAVLEAAKARLCIVSYRATPTAFGTFVSCIDEVCGGVLTPTTGTYWNMYENGVSTWYGVDGFSAQGGDELAFAYKPYCFDVVCPPDLDGI